MKLITKHRKLKYLLTLLHITPPQKAPDEIGKSEIGSDKGWIPVNKEALQHVKYSNIFALRRYSRSSNGKKQVER